MAVERQQNWLGQQRVDVPHLRALESGVAHDFDNLAGVILAGKVASVISGFDLLQTGAVGNDAEVLTLRVAGGSLIHFEATESGSVFRVPEDRAAEVLGPTNPKVQGSFTPNSTNFVGLDLRRSADDTTADTVQFLDPDSNGESPVIVPLARTMDYRIVISTTEFSSAPGIAPLAKVTTDASNKVLTLVDARHLMFRLGSGGSNPLAINPFGWPGGRNEASAALSTVAGDYSIFSFKEWLNAVMTRLWEVGGGEYWYSPTADRNVSMVSNAIFGSTGEPFEVVSNNIRWRGLRFVFDNSTSLRNEVADQLTSSPGLTDLADGECIYVDLDRTTTRTVAGLNPLVPAKGVLASLGSSARPGQRWVIAWRTGSSFFTKNQYLPIGSLYRVATQAAIGGVRLSAAPATPLGPVVATVTIAGTLMMGMAGFSRFDTGTTGNLTIGQGVSSGDFNVNITTTTSSYQTTINAGSRYSILQKAALRISQAGAVGNPFDARLLDLESYLGVAYANRLYVESGGAIGMANWEAAPAIPAPTLADPARMKFGTRPSRYWKTLPVRLATQAALPAYTFAGTGPTHILTATANGVLTVDGLNVALNDRILVRNDVEHNGIYVVTAPGDGGSPFVLTRASDCNSSDNTFNDIAVKCTAGGDYAGIAFVMSAQDGAFAETELPYVYETFSMVWDITTNLTRDLVVAKWFDGSETVIAQSPAYFV